ncbi:MAG: hypothetical protein JWP89_3107 [Schlesneria sp.]|nr:hypothetical protein [Schlesneria sp.]
MHHRNVNVRGSYVMRCLDSRSQSRQEIGQKSMCQQTQTTTARSLGDLGYKKRQATRELCHARPQHPCSSVAPTSHSWFSFASSRLGDFALKTYPRQRRLRHTPTTYPFPLFQPTEVVSCAISKSVFISVDPWPDFSFLVLSDDFTSLSPQPLPLSLLSCVERNDLPAYAKSTLHSVQHQGF